MKPQHSLRRIAQEFDQPETRVAAILLALSQPELYQCHHKCPHDQQMLKASPLRQISAAVTGQIEVHPFTEKEAP
jgi:hypothetical protein